MRCEVGRRALTLPAYEVPHKTRRERGEEIEQGLALGREDPGTLEADVGTGAGSGVPRGLTAREEEVLRYTVEGMSSTQIAQRMTVGSRTVETRRANLMRKLGVHSRAELVRHVLERRVLP